VRTLAFWKGVKTEIQPVVNTFGDGVNTYLTPFEIQNGELTDCLNMCADDYPAIRTRNDRVKINSVTTPHAIGKRNNSQMHVVDGNTWKYSSAGSTAWVDVSTGLSSTSAKFGEFATGTARYTLMMNSTQAKYWDGASTALNMDSTGIVYSKLFTVHKGHIFILKDNYVKFNALNLINDWTAVGDIGSGIINITNSVGAGSAITTYNDHVVIWCSNSMHELYGSDPLNYELKDITNDVGCCSDRSVQEVKGKLFWMDYTGVYMYTGGLPRKVSDPVKKWIDGINQAYAHLCCAGVKDEKYYIAIPYKSTANNLTLVYDTYNNKWTVEDGTFIDFENISDTLYGLSSSGTIDNMNSTGMTGLDNSTAIPYRLVTKAYNDSAVANKKSLARMYLTAEGTTTATIAIGYATNINSTTMTELTTSVTMSTEPTLTKINIPVNKLSDVNWYKLQASGSGHAKIHSLQKDIRVRK
jgi:hypothetical protein